MGKITSSPTIVKALSLALALGLLAGCGTLGTTVKPGNMGIKYDVLHEPALKKEVRTEGFYWQWPWNKMVSYDVTWQSKSEQVDILTGDDLHIKTTVTVTFRPDREKLYELTTQIGSDYYNQVIRPPFVTLTRSEFARHLHNDLARKSPKIESEILEHLRQALTGKLLEIDRISINHIEYDRAVTRAISSKIATEQMVEQKLFEVKVSESDAEIVRYAARGQADAIRINAEGEAAAIILKGNAQAKAQEAITKTLTAKYLQYKAFDNPATRYYFVPIGKDGMPLIINAD